MNWAATLISVSGYGWYLVFTYLTYGTYPSLGAGLAGLGMLALFPAWLALTLNRSLLNTSPTIYKALAANLALWLPGVGLTVLGQILALDYLFWHPPDPISPTAYILPACWQLLGWLVGAYFVYTTGGTSFSLSAGLKSMEISLALTLPWVLILTLAGFAPALLVTLIIIWFLSLTLTLALAGAGAAAKPQVRYGAVVLHTLVPPLVTLIIFAAAFGGQIRSLMQTARGAMLALLHYLVAFLLKIFPRGGTAQEGVLPTPPPPAPAGAAESYGEPGTWLLKILIILGVLICIPALLALLKLLQTRLKPGAPPPSQPRGQKTILGMLGRWLALLAQHLASAWQGLMGRGKKIIAALGQMGQTWLSRWLPAPTPGEQIWRSYQAFLRWGRRRGCPKKTHETPLEYARRLRQTTGTEAKPWPHDQVQQLTYLFLEATYSNKNPDWQQAHTSKALVQQITGRMRR